jgi:hypothetical protein
MESMIDSDTDSKGDTKAPLGTTRRTRQDLEADQQSTPQGASANRAQHESDTKSKSENGHTLSLTSTFNDNREHCRAVTPLYHHCNDTIRPL